MNERWLSDLVEHLPAHAEVVADLSRAVEGSEHWRSLLVGCSLASGRGDEFSDIDAGIGSADGLAVEELERSGLELVAHVGDVMDVLVHRFEGWPDGSRRFAVEYANGVQLDLAVFPAPWRPSRRGEVPLVDKDGDLARGVTPPAEYGKARLRRQAREWVMLGWWAVSDVAKYLQRNSLYEATDRIGMIRQHALCLFAIAHDIPDPAYGLTSLLDYPPHESPGGLADTYCRPDDRASVTDAARAVTDLLEQGAAGAGIALSEDLSTPWSHTAAARLKAVQPP